MKILALYSYEGYDDEAGPYGCKPVMALQVPDDFNYAEDQKSYFEYLRDGGVIRLTTKGHVYMNDREKAEHCYLGKLRLSFSSVLIEMVEIVLPEE